MSHSDGEVVRPGDSTLYLFEYDGTADVVIPRIHTSYEALEANWRGVDGGWDALRDCKHEAEPVLIAPSYGRGFWWNGSACFECMVIHGPLNPYDGDVEEHHGAPEHSNRAPSVPEEAE